MINFSSNEGWNLKDIEMKFWDDLLSFTECQKALSQTRKKTNMQILGWFLRGFSATPKFSRTTLVTQKKRWHASLEKPPGFSSGAILNAPCLPNQEGIWRQVVLCLCVCRGFPSKTLACTLYRTHFIFLKYMNQHWSMLINHITPYYTITTGLSCMFQGVFEGVLEHVSSHFEGILRTLPTKQHLGQVPRPILHWRGSFQKCILHFGMVPRWKVALKGWWYYTIIIHPASHGDCSRCSCILRGNFYIPNFQTWTFSWWVVYFPFGNLSKLYWKWP